LHKEPTQKSVKWLSLTKAGLKIEDEAMVALEQEVGLVNAIMVFGKLGSGM
jgi:hypothetical protein